MRRAAAIGAIAGKSNYGTLLYDAIVAASLTTNLQLCLDAGDPASWPGSGTKWLDRSGNGYDFFLGTDGTTAAPTFVGPAGNRQSYWLFNGSSYFTYDTTNETWMQNLHKNNAVLSSIEVGYNTSSAPTLYGDYGASGTTGFVKTLYRTIQVRNATAGVLTATGDTTDNENAWNISGVSLTEATGAGGGFLYLNGAYNQVSASNTFDSTYSSPAAGNATSTFQIGALGDGAVAAGAGTRLSCIAIWGGTAISKANMDTLWASMRGRFGL